MITATATGRLAMAIYKTKYSMYIENAYNVYTLTPSQHIIYIQDKLDCAVRRRESRFVALLGSHRTTQTHIQHSIFHSHRARLPSCKLQFSRTPPTPHSHVLCYPQFDITMAANWLPLESNPDVRRGLRRIFAPRFVGCIILKTSFSTQRAGPEQIHPDVGRVAQVERRRCDGSRTRDAGVDSEAGEGLYSALSDFGHGIYNTQIK